jgi:16S rRNA (adenine1518-N6/adenine1519-N6)-dimethyltransferase
MIPPRNLLNTSQIWAKKDLGQHFLNTPTIAQKIVQSAQIDRTDVIIEIGAGLGALTVAAAKRSKKLYAIEKDSQIVPLLTTQLRAEGIENTSIIADSFFNVDLNNIARDNGQPLIILGNLPYNVSSQIIVSLIQCRSVVHRAILMLQKEVAQRLTAGPNNKKYGRLTVMLNYCADIRSLFTVGPAHFFPRPKVDSEVIEIKFRETFFLSAKIEALLFDVIKSAFGQRRKTLKNALANSPLPFDRQKVEQNLRKAGIDPQRRAETLTAQEYVTLTGYLASEISLST